MWFLLAYEFLSHAYLFLTFLLVILIAFGVHRLRVAPPINTNKISIGIVIFLLSATTSACALGKSQQAYQAEDKPEGVAFNYLFAMQ